MKKPTIASKVSTLTVSGYLAACLTLGSLASAEPMLATPHTAPHVQERTMEREERVKGKQHRVIIRRDATMLGGGGFMGVEVLPLTAELREHFGADSDRGVMISKVSPDSPAEAAGIRVGDILLTVDGEDIRGVEVLSSLIRRREEGETVTIDLIRNGGTESVSLMIDEREGGGVYRVGPGTFGFFGSGEEHVIGPHENFEFEWTDDSRKAFEEAMETLGERIESGEWKDKMELIESMDFSRVQERMIEVERRLKELEKELEKKSQK